MKWPIVQSRLAPLALPCAFGQTPDLRMTLSRLSTLAFVSLLICATAPAAAQTPEEAPVAPTAASTKPDDAQMICTRTRQTGSHRVSRVCRSPEQARAERKAAEESMRRKRSQPAADDR